MTPSPRIRGDLSATPVEANGTRFVDVERPDNGLMMRLFDFEWELSQRMDGVTSWEDLSAWARIQLKKQISVDELAVLAARLETAGFFEKEHAPAAEPAPVAAPEPVAPTAAPAPEPVAAPEPIAAAPVAEASAEPSGGKSDPAKLAALAQSLKVKDKPKHDELKQFFTQPHKVPDDHEPPRRRGPNISSALLSGIGICAVLMALPLLVYYTFMKPAPIWKVHTQPAEQKDVVELFDGAGAIRQSAPVPLSFGVAGKIGQVAAAGTPVKPGDSVAALAEKATVEDGIEKLKRRLEHYGKQKDTKKVAEKQKALAAEEQKLVPLDLKAPASFAGGQVVQVVAPVGTSVTAGQPVLTLGDPRKLAELPVADPTDFRPGMPLEVQSGETFLHGKVDKVEGGHVLVELDGGAIGDPVRMVKRHAIGITRVPASSVVLRGGISTVFVFEDGRVRARKVNVLERTPTEAKLSSGLKGGEPIVLTPSETMQDDEPATLADQGGPK